MSEHTKEPWTTSGSGIRMIIRGDDLMIVAVRHRVNADIHEANFRRIVACVNACAGLSTDDLEDSSMTILEHMLDQYGERLTALTTQRDDLLATLKSAEQYLTTRITGTHGYGETILLPIMRSAIASVEQPKGEITE